MENNKIEYSTDFTLTILTIILFLFLCIISVIFQFYEYRSEYNRNHQEKMLQAINSIRDGKEFKPSFGDLVVVSKTIPFRINNRLGIGEKKYKEWFCLEAGDVLEIRSFHYHEEETKDLEVQLFPKDHAKRQYKYTEFVVPRSKLLEMHNEYKHYVEKMDALEELKANNLCHDCDWHDFLCTISKWWEKF